MRVVKGFSREEYEKKKFAGRGGCHLPRTLPKAERIVAFNTPLMNFCMYFNMAFILLDRFEAGNHSIPKQAINIGQISATPELRDGRC